MKNREKYADKIINATILNPTINGSTCQNVRKIAGLKCSCEECGQCTKKYAAWLKDEYVEPPVDWSKVEVDTPILVSMDGKDWKKRHFASYVDGVVKAWDDGRTSHTEKETCPWCYAKLAEENK